MSYFATKPINELLPELVKKRQNFFKYKEQSGDAKRWRRAYDLYYGYHVDEGDNTTVAHVGEDEELTAYGINYYRNLVRHILALTCSQKPSYDYRAKNTDLRSLQQAKLANSIIDSYLVEKRMGRHMKQAAERSLVFKEGFVYQQWDLSQGRAITTKPVLNDDNTPKLDENNQPIQKIVNEGDASMVSKSPWEIVRDTNLRDWSKCNWVEVTEFENKYDVAAQYPQKKEQIEGLADDRDKAEFQIDRIARRKFQDNESDLIPVRYFYHLPTASCAAGRFTKYVGNDIDLYDGAYPYPSPSGNHKLPVQRITPGEMFDTIDGYTDFNDIMVLQQVLNVLMSTAFTNEQAFGTQAIWMPDGCEISSEEVGKGMVVLKGGPPGSEPKPIQLTATPAEIFKNAEYVEGAMSKLVGLNDVVTGASDKDLSGAAIGRYQAMAIQYSSNFQQSWAELQEDGGTFLLYLLQNFANTKRMTALAGKSNKGAMKAWTGKDIDMIDRLICDLGNPMSRTYTGRMDTADKFLDKGLIKDPSQYFQLIETGNMDPMLEGPMSKLELIRKENEMLMEGTPAHAMVGDSHIQHAQEHRVILDDPEIRSAAAAGDQFAIQIVKVTTQHIMEHNQLNNTQDPFWFVVSGEQPPPMPLPPNGGQPPPGASSGPQEPLPPPPVGPPQQPPEAPPIPPMGDTVPPPAPPGG